MLITGSAENVFGERNPNNLNDGYNVSVQRKLYKMECSTKLYPKSKWNFTLQILTRASHTKSLNVSQWFLFCTHFDWNDLLKIIRIQSRRIKCFRRARRAPKISDLIIRHYPWGNVQLVKLVESGVSYLRGKLRENVRGICIVVGMIDSRL